MCAGLNGGIAHQRREDQRVIVDFGPLTLEIKARAKRVRVEAAPGKIALDSIGPVATEHPGGDAVENQISGLVRMKRKGRIAAERSDLVVEVLSQHTLHRQYPIIVLLKLSFSSTG